MGALLVPAKHLSPTTRARVAHCGAPLTYVTPDGPQDGRWSCGSSWCEWCADRRRSRARAIITARLEPPDVEDAGDVVMLTLTIPHRADYSAEYLASQIRKVADIWRETMTRIRWSTWRARRGQLEPWERLPAPGRGGPHPVFASTYDGAWHGECRAGVWVREITTGSSASPGFHVHMHVIVPSREDAEMLNAAWQASCADQGVVSRGRWTSSNMREMPSARAGRYVAKYLTKQDVRDVPEHLVGAYIEGSRGMRRCDAWGDWRPLGLARVAGDATHVHPPEWDTAVDIALWFGETPLSRWLRTGRPPQFADAWTDMHIEAPPAHVLAMLAETDDPQLLAESKAAALAVARSLGRTAPAGAVEQTYVCPPTNEQGTNNEQSRRSHPEARAETA